MADTFAVLIPPLLRRRGAFRLFWLGQTISLFGDQITLVAVPLVAVLQLRAGPVAMGLLVAAAWLPYLLFALHAGVWVDRRGRRRRLMITADLGRALFLLSVPAAAALHRLTLAQLYAVVFINGSLSVLFSVSYQTLFVSLIPREEYVQGMGLLHGSRAFSFVAGPSVAGFLVQLFSGPAALVADAVSFLASALALRGIRAAEPPPASKGEGGIMTGLRFIVHSPIMRASLAATATINLFNLAYNALSVLYLVTRLQLQPATIGLLFGLGAVGGLIGSVVTGRLVKMIGVGRAYLAGCFLFTAPLILVPLAGGPRPLVLGMLLTAGVTAAFGVLVLDISVGSIFAALIPNQLRSRVSGAYTVVNYGVRPVGSILGGVLGTVLGLRPTLFLVTLAATAGVLILLLSPVPRLRELPETAVASEAPAGEAGSR